MANNNQSNNPHDKHSKKAYHKRNNKRNNRTNSYNQFVGSNQPNQRYFGPSMTDYYGNLRHYDQYYQPGYPSYYQPNQYAQPNPNFQSLYPQSNYPYGSKFIDEINQSRPHKLPNSETDPEVDPKIDQTKTNTTPTEKKSTVGIIGSGRTKKSSDKTSKSALNPNADPFTPSGLFGGGSSGLFGGSSSIPIITVDMNDKNSSDHPLKDIFKALLGLSEAESEPLSESKLKIKTFDPDATYTEITDTVKTLDDLIKLADLYDETKPELMASYTVDLKQLNKMKEPLLNLKNMIGMEGVKKSIVNQIMYFLQGIEEQQDMLHMVITGSPGTGKTSLGMILAKLYYSMGLLDSKQSVNPITGKSEDFVFKIYKRADLIGQYLGHTAIKTQKAIDECVGGVMFLDEAYSLGHEEKSDIYTKECLDTINQNLSEKKKNFILIIAGYPDQLDKCFFAHNEGLKRRFAFRYHIDKYTPKELCQILKLKIEQNGWKLSEKITDENIIKLIESSKDMFENFGGDIESWNLHIKISHGVRIFGKHPKLRRIIELDDLTNGLEAFKSAKENAAAKERERISRQILQTMYA